MPDVKAYLEVLATKLEEIRPKAAIVRRQRSGLMGPRRSRSTSGRPIRTCSSFHRAPYARGTIVGLTDPTRRLTQDPASAIVIMMR